MIKGKLEIINIENDDVIVTSGCNHQTHYFKQDASNIIECIYDNKDGIWISMRLANHLTGLDQATFSNMRYVDTQGYGRLSVGDVDNVYYIENSQIVKCNEKHTIAGGQ